MFVPGLNKFLSYFRETEFYRELRYHRILIIYHSTSILTDTN